MTTLAAVIIEDEKRNITFLKEIISNACPEIRIVGEAGGVESARDIILKLKPEIIFLDIQLNDGNGFHLLQLLEEDKKQGNLTGFHVVFTTASDQHAVQAFRFSAVDYLLKPIISSELKEAVKRVTQLKAANKSEGVNQHEVLINNLLKVDTEKKICLATFDELKIYSISDITRCESQHNYTTFYFIQDKPILISKTIKDYEELLKDFGFIRVHQSHLINIKYIKAFIKREGGFVRMIDDVEVPVSRRKKEEVLEILNKM